jgi:hypothetical protein
MKTLGTFFVAALCIAIMSTTAWGQVLLPSSGFVDINFNSFTGSGFTLTPAAGQLDSDTWRVWGMSAGGFGTFGGTHTEPDYARGTSTGGVAAGGVYAFEVSSGDFSFGVQADDGDFTPGQITLKIQNNTGGPLTKLNLSYDIYVYNNQNRSSSFNLSYSTDDASYTDILGLDFTSPETLDAFPSWTSVNRTTSITALSVADGAVLYLKWTSDDVGGSGGRDELAFDNLLLSFGDEPLPVQISSFTGVYITANSVQLDWRTTGELNNYGFFVERRGVTQHTFVELPNSFIPGHGTTLISHYYTYTDISANGETWFYRLRQIDLDGTIHYTEGIQVDVLTDVEAEPLPTVYALEQNYPNPFNPSTQIQFALPQESRVRLEVFNIIGERVANLVDETRSVGYYSERFYSTGLASGFYFYRIQASDPLTSNGPRFVDVKKFLLLK